MNLSKIYTIFLVCYTLTPMVSFGMWSGTDRDKYNEHRFLDAAAYGIVANVANWLDGGVYIDCMDGKGRTALWLAVANGKIEVVELLIARGAKINSVDENGMSSLRAAVNYNQPIIVKRLLAAQANVDLPDKQEMTPFALAASAGLTNIAAMLLTAGADHGIRTRNDDTALSLAIRGNHADIIDLFKDGTYLDYACMPDGWHPVSYAAFQGSHEALKTLLLKGTSVNFYRKGCKSALGWAAMCGYLECVRILLAHGADVDHCTQEGDTPLWCAAGNGHVDVVRVLLEAGASLQHEVEGVSVLQIAQERGHGNVVQILKERMSARETSRKVLEELIQSVGITNEAEPSHV